MPPTATQAPASASAEGKPPRFLREREMVVLASLAAGAGLVLVGGVTASLDTEQAYRIGVTLVAAGLMLLVTATIAGQGMSILRVAVRKQTGGSRYDQLRYWTRLKASAILLNLLVLSSALVLALSLMRRVEHVSLTAPLPIVLRSTTLLTVAVAMTMVAAYYLSLRMRLERTPSVTSDIFLYIGLIAASTFATLAAVLTTTPLRILGLVGFGPNDAPFFLLASATVAATSLVAGRSLPTLYSLFVLRRGYDRGPSYLSPSKSILMPVMMAFALLFLVVLVLLLFGVGLVGLVEDIPRNNVLLGVFGFIVAALTVSVVVSVMLSRSEDRAVLYRQRRSAESRQRLLILGGSGALTAALALITLHLALGGEFHGLRKERWPDMFCFALMAALGPYGFYVASRFRRIRRLEERFPDFLRDLAASRKAGLTLTASVSIASRGEYGALTPEIVKMADQLSWNVPFDEALDRFRRRVHTPLIERAISLVIEASRSGGNVTDVLLAASRDARELKNLENERRTTIGLYTVIIYITFFVFLSVVAVLYGSFVPEILRTSQAAAAQGASGFAGVTFGTLTLNDYREFYFLAALLQGVGNGFVAGLMGSGRFLDGLRHSFVMVLVAYVTFTVLVTPT